MKQHAGTAGQEEECAVYAEMQTRPGPRSFADKCGRKKPFLSQRRAGNKVPAAFLNFSILKVPSLFHYKIILSEARGVTM